MGNRKVLINRHTSTSGAPIASEMFKGEIAVAHKTGEEILWTKNNDNEMVPFISCAQTMTMINNAISDADVTYDVKAANGDAHVEVVSGGTEKAKVFTVSSKDVQSKEAFDAYSADTKQRIDKNASAITKTLGIVSALTDIVVTEINGDNIITATVVENNTGSNAYNLTHKQAPAAVATGFNKLATDAYGHVTASTAVVAADIKSLGFEDSAWTEEKIASAITALDSDSATTDNRHYVTAITIEDGKIVSFGEATDPRLSVESAGTGNVISEITVDDHKITYQTVSVATSDDVQKLSAATIAFSAETVNEFSSAFTAINNLSAGTQHDIKELSGNVVEYVKVVSGNIETVINELSANTMAGDAAVFTSAKTYTDGVIESLDSEGKVSSAGKYLTGIGIANGKISGITEADLPKLSSASTGDGNVVTDIQVNDHAITFVKGITVASEDDLKAVSGIVDTFSAATVAEFSSAFTAIQAMDKSASAEDGKVVTTVSEVDGVVSETKANVKDLQLGGYVKDTTATGDIASTDTINAALSKLENKANAITIANADGSINVTTGSTGTDINVNIKSGEHVLAKDGNAGLYTDLDLVKITTGLPETVKERYQLLATDDSQIGVNIDVPKDSHIVSINYITTGEHAQNLEYVYIDASGQTQTTYVDMSELVLETEFASGVTVTDHIAHGVVDPTSENFLTVGGAGFKLSGVQDAIDAAIEALDKTDDAAVAGQYVAAIEETDGVVAVKTRANVSEAVLNNYSKGSDATAVAAADTINQAISKLENQIDAAKAAATTKVVEGTDAGNNMTITPTTSATDGSVTYTIDLTDVASKTALDAEIAARKAVDGQTGQTYAANANTNYITGATSLNDADVKLDAALKNVADQVSALDYAGLTDENTKVVTDVKQEDGLVSASATTVGDLVITAITTADTKVAANDNLATIAGKLQGQIDAMDSSAVATDSGHYITAITITDGKITATGQEALPAATPVTTANGTTGNTVAPVLVGITPGGTEGHELTLNYTNKVLSAQTADEAAHASAATKVDNAISFSGYSDSSAATLDTAFAYDGSAPQSLTFGTNGPAGLKSMSMTSAGLVDVEVIDCGEY